MPKLKVKIPVEQSFLIEMLRELVNNVLALHKSYKNVQVVLSSEGAKHVIVYEVYGKSYDSYVTTKPDSETPTRSSETGRLSEPETLGSIEPGEAGEVLNGEELLPEEGAAVEWWPPEKYEEILRKYSSESS